VGATVDNPAADHGLLGRAEELEDLRAALAASRAGHGGLVTVTGDPGIGKTRLLDALGEEAATADVAVCWGRCWEAGGAPAYWPWTQVLRTLLGPEGPLEERPELHGAGPWLAHLVPELMPHERPAPNADSDEARFAMFDAVAGVLRGAARAKPVLVALEDLHAADVPSLLLLEFIAGTLHDEPLLIVATYRDMEASQRAEAGPVLARVADLSTPIRLGGLDSTDIARLVSRDAGAAPEADLVKALHDVTEGNPLYAEEMLRLLLADGPLPQRPGRAALRLPRSMRATIRRRLALLPDPTIAILERAAVVGRDFRLRTLEAVGGFERLPLLEALDSAVAAGVLRRDKHEVGRYRFAHVLFREALYEELAEAERVRFHAEIGNALEELHADAIEHHLSEIAHHFLAAAPGGEAERAIDYATRAGHRSLAMAGYEEAVDHFERALAALELTAASGLRGADLLVALGAARMRAGNTPGAREAYMAAADLGRDLGSPEHIARAALGMGVWGMTPAVDEDLIGLLEEAMERLTEPSALRARVLSRLSSAKYWLPDRGERERLSRAALSLAGSVVDVRERGFVLVHAYIGNWGPETLAEREALADELRGLAEHAGDHELRVHAQLFRIPVLLERGDIAGVAREVGELERLVGRLHQPRLRWLVPTHLAMLAGIEGRWSDWEAHHARLVEAASKVPGTVADVVSMSQAFAVRWAQCRTPEMLPIAEAWADAQPAQPVWRCLLALSLVESGSAARAEGIIASLAANDFVDIPHDQPWLVALALIAETLDRLDQEGPAELVYEQLAPFAGRHVATAQGVWVGPVDRFLGLLATLRGDPDRALEHLAVARTGAQRMNSPPTLVHVDLAEARALERRGGPGDSERARELREQARAIAEELEMPAVVERIDGLLGREAPPARGAKPAAAPSAAEAMLVREGEVWLLRFQGHDVRLRDAKGLHYIATLLENPGVEIHALELMGDPGATGISKRAAEAAGLQSAGDDAGPALDAKAKRAYSARLDELREEIEEADAFNDPERASRAREELDFLAGELAGAVGLGGRDRPQSSNAERARVNVTRAIRTILKRIAQLDPALGQELEVTVRTGTFCVHTPDPRVPVVWRVDRG
jgi:tetratricopeptide (TPR) repeat protein